MDKVQKIREEVKKLMYGFNLEADIASCEDAEAEKLADIKYQLCKKILDYIDNVQKEPVSDDLEKASDDYAHSTLVGSSSVKKNSFKAGARWQQEKDKKWLADNHKQIFNNGWEEGFEDGRDDAYDEQEELVSEDLEEAADNAFNNVLNNHEIVNVRSCLEMFRFGAEWKEKQIIAKAINGTARPDDNEIWCNLTSNNLEDGDKVKVILIKED